MLHLEQLEDRCLPAVTAFFAAGVLSVVGDDAANAIVVAADAQGTIQVTDFGQVVAIRGDRPTLATTTRIGIDGQRGNDSLITDGSLNQLINQGQAPDVTLLGGAGHDTLQVKSGGIVGGLAGVDANGNVVGRVVGNAFMDGGHGDDTLVSGFGNDVMRGGRGDDTYVWLPGTLTDVWDGGQGNDTVIILGNDGPADLFQLAASDDRVRFDRLNLVRFSVDIGTTETIILRPGQGDDTVVLADLTGVKSLRRVTVEGGQGDDAIDARAQANAAIRLDLDAETIQSTVNHQKSGTGRKP